MPYGYAVYFTERPKNRVIRWEPDTGEARVVAGEPADGDPSQKLRDPYGLAVDAGGSLLIADKLNHRICRLKWSGLERMEISDADGHRSSIRGPLRYNPFCPTSLFVEKGGSLICTYSDDHTIYRIHADGRMELLLGIPAGLHYYHSGLQDFGPHRDAKTIPLNTPTGVVKRSDGTLFFIERGYQTIREYHPSRGLRSPFPAFGVAPLCEGAMPKTVEIRAYRPIYPTSLALDEDENLCISDAVQRCVWQVDAKKERLRLMVQILPAGQDDRGGPAAITFGPDGTLWVLDYGRGTISGFRRKRTGSWSEVEECAATVKDGVSCTATEGAGVACG